MSLKFCSFSSDSSGNCYLVRSETTALLIDVGISGTKICNGLILKGLEANEIDGVLLTHEHIDHVKSVSVIAKKNDALHFYCSPGTHSRVKDKLAERRFIDVEPGVEFNIGDIKVESFNLSHDATEPIGYALSNDSGKIVIVTDTGCITKEIFAKIKEADMLIIEANHEVNILLMGAYPYPTKRRILGEYGHLSNETTGHCICDYLKTGKNDENRQVILAHMSKNNNTPEQAYLTIKNILEEDGFRINKDLQLSIITKDQVSPDYTL